MTGEAAGVATGGSRTRSAFLLRRAAAAGLIASTLVATGCGSANTTPPLFAAADIPITLTEFRIRLNDYTEYFVATIDEASEDVIDGTLNQDVRRNAMEFRLRAVNMFLNSLNQPDPVAAVIDAWALTVQLGDFLEPGGAGETLFGDYQQQMVEAAHRTQTELERVVYAVAQRPVPTAAEVVYAWAEANPLMSAMMVRESSAVLVAEQLESQDGGALAALGRLQAGVDDLVAQYQRYISVMPRTLRWHSQLILHETMYDELRIGATIDAVAQLSDYVGELQTLTDDFLTAFPDRAAIEAELAAALSELEPLIEAERTRLQAEIDRQRELIFADVDDQREMIMLDVEAQIADLDAQMQQRIDEIFDRIETLTNETVEESFSRSESLINLVYYRVMVLLLVALAGGAALMVLRKRLQ